MDGQLGVEEEILEKMTDLSVSDSLIVDYEKEGEIAADYIEEFLDIADIDGDLDIEVKNGRTYISLTADENSNLNDLVGKNGKVLLALQELSRLAVLQNLKARSRFILDVQKYRNRKAEYLKTLAQEAVEEVDDIGKTVHMKPLGAYERKIIHDEIAALGFYSESEGKGLNRHVVVSKLEE